MADITDAEYSAHYHEMVTALQVLVDSGQMQSGTVARLETVPVPFLMVFYNRGVVYGKTNKPDPSIADLDTYLWLDVTGKYGLSGLAADWLGSYPQYYIYTDEANALNDQAQAICSNILAQSSMQKDLFFNMGALYFPKEIESSF